MARLQLSLLALFSLCLSLFTSGVFSQSTFTISNACNYPVWPALLPNSGSPPPPTTGFMLTSNSYATLSMPPSWSGRIWARTLCSDNGQYFACATGDCRSGAVECPGGGNPPITLAEIRLDGYAGLDYYDISLVTGFNLPMSVVPQGGSGACASLTCSANINAACPSLLQDVGSDGQVVGCKSACVAFGDPQDCCTGAYAPPACGPTSYSEFFKSECPQAFTYASDPDTVITCASADFTIKFCP